MSKVGIVVIGYENGNSLSRLLRGVNSAEYNADDVKLIISMDYCQNEKAYEIARDFEWNHGIKYVVLNKPRLGLRNHIIRCGSYMKEYELDAVVVLEDDIFPARDFYVYAESAVDQYLNNSDIAGISLYSWNRNRYGKMFRPVKTGYDAYFMKFAQSWGQVWLREAWDDFIRWYECNKNFEQSLDIPEYLYAWGDNSWLKYHIRYCLEMNKYFVYPYESKTTCFNEVGEHTDKQTDINQVEITNAEGRTYKFPKLIESVHYDAFYENEDLYKYCGVNKDDITVDIYSTKRKTNTRYLLTSRIMDYPIVKQWSDRMIPAEQNIIHQIEGKGLYLYDFGEKVNKVLDVVTSYNNDGSRDRFGLLNKYLNMLEAGEEYVLSDELMSVKQVAIYGYGVMGKHLAFMLKRTKVAIPYVIDNNCDDTDDVKVYRMGDMLPNVDMIIVSVLEDCEEIKTQLEQYYDYRVIDIREVEWKKRL